MTNQQPNCPRCEGPLVPVLWLSSAAETDGKPPVRDHEEFGRCVCCGWETTFGVVSPAGDEMAVK